MSRPRTRLVLVRHGESVVMVDQVIGGHAACTGLSPLGRRQAEALRDRLGATGELGVVDALYASVLPRAVETAQIVNPAIGDLPIGQHCELCEVHPGEEVDGLSWEEFRARHPRLDGPPDPFRPWSPGGESWAEFVTRTGRKLHELARAHAGRTIVVACHGGVVAASFVALGGLPLVDRMELRATNTSLTEWSRPADDADADWRLERYNDAGHLAALEPVATDGHLASADAQGG